MVLIMGFMWFHDQSENEGNLVGKSSPRYGTAVYEENEHRAPYAECGDHDDPLGGSPDGALLDSPFAGKRQLSKEMTREKCHQLAPGKVVVSTGGCSGKSHIVCNPPGHFQKPPEISRGSRENWPQRKSETN